MLFPLINEPGQSRLFQQEFKGYNHNLRIGEGEFYNTKNLTNEYYPVLSERKRRGFVRELTDAQGMISKDSIAYVDNHKLYYNDAEVVGLTLTEGEKQLVSMGAYICIFPDKKYVNTKDFTDYGSMEAEKETTGDVKLSLSKRDGTEYSNVSTTAPEVPENGVLWLDTSGEKHVLKQYSEEAAMWMEVATTYIKITATEIGKRFNEGDGVHISGLTTDGVLKSQVEALNGNQIIQSKGDNFIVVIGLVDTVHLQTEPVTVKRKLPEMDFVCEAGNRLWGCFYGNVDGKTVNELYCCKLGDFKNWYVYSGVSTDSWAASLGSDGQFTGAITHLGCPIFFKEDCFHKVYVSSAGAHQIVNVEARGIQKGSHKSAVIVNETLFYKSRSDVCYYDGSLPTGISSALGSEKYYNGVSGAFGSKYYISMDDSDGLSHLFVFDIEKGTWIHEDNVRAKFFVKNKDELYMICDNQLWALNGTVGTLEDSFEWSFETGNFGYTYPDKKYLSRFNLRLGMQEGTSMTVYVQYNSDGVWHEKGTISKAALNTFTLPIIPVRCDHMKVKIEGTGSFKLYSIAKILEEGSDV
ncbi:MAG: hypothetical protein HFE74_04455 [Firmicutes bacterium]|jgi:hypothetical protein|nr:hypothetical protein [Bacillota bacterium]